MEVGHGGENDYKVQNKQLKDVGTALALSGASGMEPSPLRDGRTSLLTRAGVGLDSKT